MALPEVKPLRPTRPLVPRLLAWTTWAAFALLFYISVVQTNFGFNDLWGSAVNFVRFFGRFYPPDWRALPEIWTPLIQTLQMAWLGTVFGVILGLPWVVWASRNTTLNGPFMWFARSLMTVLRSIPDLLYAAVFVAILAFGPLPGVVALTVFTMSILAKLGSEYIEAIDPGPLEALKATGANGTHVVVFGVVPQVAANMISFILYIFEVNVRASTVLGYVGAGGIGQLLRLYISDFDYPAIAVLLIIVFAVVLVIDGVSAFVRSRLT